VFNNGFSHAVFSRGRPMTHKQAVIKRFFTFPMAPQSQVFRVNYQAFQQSSYSPHAHITIASGQWCTSILLNDNVTGFAFPADDDVIQQPQWGRGLK
jgi:hypothetical protein